MLYSTLHNILKTYTPLYSYNLFTFNAILLLVILLNDVYSLNQYQWYLFSNPNKLK